MRKAISYVMLFSILLSFVAVFPLQVKADEPTTEIEKFVAELNGYLDPALQLSVDGDKLVSNHNDPYGEKYVVQTDFDSNAITVLCSGASQDSQYVPDNVGIQVEYSSETGASVTALGDIEIDGAVAKAEAPVFEAATTSSNYAPVAKEYTITWVIDGNSTTEVYTEGSMPTHSIPVKEASSTKKYAFTGWNPAITSVTEDATYTAIFSETNIVTAKINNYTITVAPNTTWNTFVANHSNAFTIVDGYVCTVTPSIINGNSGVLAAGVPSPTKGDIVEVNPGTSQGNYSYGNASTSTITGVVTLNGVAVSPYSVINVAQYYTDTYIKAGLVNYNIIVKNGITWENFVGSHSSKFEIRNIEGVNYVVVLDSHIINGSGVLAEESPVAIYDTENYTVVVDGNGNPVSPKDTVKAQKYGTCVKTVSLW